MNIMSLLAAVKAPHDLWTIIIDWIQGAGINFGWTILLFTLIVKVATSPLDFMVKYTTKKQTLIQKKCSPQVAKLQKKFGNDQKTLQTQTQALYKREGLNMGTGCIIMLVNMILTCVIFFSLFATLREVSAYETIKQYEVIEANYSKEFYQTAISESSGTLTDEASVDAWVDNYLANKKIVDKTKEENKTSEEYLNAKAVVDANKDRIDSATNAAKETIIPTWNEVKETWLWVDNIWVADSTVSPFPDYASLKTMAESGGNYYKNYVKKNISKSDFNTISSVINSESDREYNGYYIIAIAVGLVTFLSQWINDLHNNLKSKNANTLAKASESTAGLGKSMKMMNIILPIVMVVFTLTSGASFGIYLLTSNLVAIGIGEISALIINALTKKTRLEVEETLEKEAQRLIKKGKLQG